MHHLILVAGLTGFATPALANVTSAEDFVKKAASANQFEIESSEIALEKSQNEEVKNFAQSVLEDHKNAGDQLESAVEASDVDAEVSEELDSKHKKMIDELQAASGSQFDSKYVSMQKSAHKEAVNLFDSYAKQGKDKELQDYAQDTLPVLQGHARHVDQLKLSQNRGASSSPDTGQNQ